MNIRQLAELEDIKYFEDKYKQTRSPKVLRQLNLLKAVYTILWE